MLAIVFEKLAREIELAFRFLRRRLPKENRKCVGLQFLQGLASLAPADAIVTEARVENECARGTTSTTRVFSPKHGYTVRRRTTAKA